MPRRSKTTKTRKYKKRSYRKRRGVAGTSMLKGNYIGFPSNRVVKMRYATQTLLDMTSVGAAQYTFLANSIYDPDSTTTGHQPLGHDQWQNFYNHYVVLGSKITVYLTGTSSAESGGAMCTIQLSDDLTTSTDVTVQIEQGRGTYKLINGFTGINPIKITSRYSAKKFFNIKDVKDNLDRIGVGFGADPADVAAYVLTVKDLNSTTGSILKLDAFVVIDYVVLLSEPKELPQS